MRWLRSNPFLSLAFLTVVIGALYHAGGLNRSAPPDSPLHTAIYVIGFLFITATRVSHSMISSPAVAGLVALPFALLPYLLADWLVRRFQRKHTAV